MLEERLHQNKFTDSSFYTEERLHTEAFTQTSVYTQKLLHRNVLTHRHFYRPELLHREAFTETFTQKSVYTQERLHRGAFTPRHLYTQELLHRRGLHRRLQNLNFSSVFAHRPSCRAKGLRGTLEIAIFLQFLHINPHFVRKGAFRNPVFGCPSA